MVLIPNGHTLIDGKHFTGCYAADIQLDISHGVFYCLIGTTKVTRLKRRLLKCRHSIRQAVTFDRA